MRNLHRLILLSTALVAGASASESTSIFTDASVDANLRYYYIQTDKKPANGNDTSAYANAIGGHLSVETKKFHGFYTKLNMMTTNPFSLPDLVDTSVLSKDNGARGLNPEEGITILGEAYIGFETKQYDIQVGRKSIDTPLISSKDVRMLPSTVSGVFTHYKFNDTVNIELAYINRFKHRTSDKFMNIVHHALGNDARNIVGSEDEYVVQFGLNYKSNDFSARLYNDYANNFMNALYLDVNKKIDNVTLYAQYMTQKSVGNAHDNLAKVNSVTTGRTIDANAFALKAELALSTSKFGIAYSNILKDDSKHDSLVLPWDGTALYTNMITSNDLFQSIYGKALTADSVYIAGTQGVKVFYKQKFDSYGLKGISTSLSYLNSFNSKYANNQQDYNIVLSYKYNKSFSIASKTMIVKHNTAMVDSLKTISQVEDFAQYRVIANYTF